MFLGKSHIQCAFWRIQQKKTKKIEINIMEIGKRKSSICSLNHMVIWHRHSATDISVWFVISLSLSHSIAKFFSEKIISKFKLLKLIDMPEYIRMWLLLRFAFTHFYEVNKLSQNKFNKGNGKCRLQMTEIVCIYSDISSSNNANYLKLIYSPIFN